MMKLSFSSILVLVVIVVSSGFAQEDSIATDRQNFLTGKPVNIITSDKSQNVSLPPIFLIAGLGAIMIVLFIVIYIIKKQKTQQNFA